jgi:beta-lactam-binding protein with PASTA domain/tRNA A-37 threonylcarbamoyl transferase component Bud32
VTDGFEEGQLIDNRYRIERKLGAGGMADVYLAEDQTLGRRVALKVLLKRFVDDEQFVERFRREAKSAAGLNHPNLVSIYDWGQIGPLYYIVMEYVEGETLKDLIRRKGRLAGGEAVAIALELLAAVDFAHAHHVVHRDIKSQNILIDRAGKVKVTDFGIARAGDSSMTEAGSILGTAQYLAPEQARGEAVDERSDLYSVGVVLYEMLTGGVPFKGDSAVSVALKHVNELPREPAELVPGLPYSLNQIVLKALAKRPDRRYASAAEFGRDLRSAQVGGPRVAATFNFASECTQVLAPLAAGGEGETQVMSRDRLANTQGDRTRRKKRSPWPIILIVLLVLVAAAAAWALSRALFGGTSVVPGVVGQSEATARAKLEGKGFKVKINHEYSDAYQAGLVTRQQPAADTKLINGGTVEIWVCKGPLTIVLTNLRGLTAAQAAAYLTGNGLVPKELKGPSTLPIGNVYRQDPPPQTSVKRGDTVTYWVTSGVLQVKVPDLSGMSKADAEAKLIAAGLVVGLETPGTSDTVPAGNVINQSPPPDTKVDRGSSVDIVVSTGPGTPSPTGTPTLVPDVYGMDTMTASDALSADGFVPIVKEKHSDQAPDTVIGMSPEAGTMAPFGSDVTITVAK